MTPALATADGWSSTARAVAWSPLLALCLTGPAMVGLAGFLDHGDRWAGLVEAALALTAVACAFAVDDVVTQAAPASPTGVRTRLAARIAIAVPVVAIVWLGIALGFGVDDLAAQAKAGIGVAAAALAVAVAAARRWPMISPGAGGVLVVAGGLFMLAVVPRAWIGWLPTGWRACTGIAAGTAIAVLWGTREPA